MFKLQISNSTLFAYCKKALAKKALAKNVHCGIWTKLQFSNKLKSFLAQNCQSFDGMIDNMTVTVKYRLKRFCETLTIS